jgi:hypothetical protein
MAEKDIFNLANLVGITDSTKLAMFVGEVADHTQKYKLTPSFDLLKHWGINSHDNNRIHLYREYAQDAGFETTPTHATLIAAHAEQYVLGLMDIIKKFNSEFNLKYSEQGFNFRGPLYPTDDVAKVDGGTLEWSLTDPSIQDGNLLFFLSGINGRNKALVRSLERRKPNAIFRGEAEDTSKYLAPFASKDVNILVEESYDIKASERQENYNLLEVEFREEVLFTQAASLIPAALLSLSSKETGRPEGVYRSQNLVFHNQPRDGEFETRVRLAAAPDIRKRAITYYFNAIVMQNDKLVVSGDLVCSSTYELKVD